MPAATPRRRRRCNKSAIRGQGRKEAIQRFCQAAESAGSDGFRQHLLDFDRNPIAIDQHDAGSHRKSVSEYLDLVGLGGVEFDDGTPAEAHHLMNRHRRGSKNHHKIDADVIESWHWTSYRTDKRKIAYPEITTLWLANG
jgi:hypothetical protein